MSLHWRSPWSCLSYFCITACRSWYVTWLTLLCHRYSSPEFPIVYLVYFSEQFDINVGTQVSIPTWRVNSWLDINLLEFQRNTSRANRFFYLTAAYRIQELIARQGICYKVEVTYLHFDRWDETSLFWVPRSTLLSSKIMDSLLPCYSTITNISSTKGFTSARLGTHVDVLHLRIGSSIHYSSRA